MKKVLAFVFALACFTSMNADEYYLVGGCTECGWNSGAWTRSTVRATQTGENTYAAAVRLTVGDGDAGRFKIPNSGDGWNGFWAPAQGTVLTSEWSDLSTDGTGDNKWCVAEEGMYLVSFNTSTLKIKADKLTEPAKDGDVFLISSLNDYWYFAAYIATDATKSSKARLTADLTFDANFVCLASDKFKFSGEFDGNGHTIDYAVAQCTYSQVGLFTYVTNGTNIHDLVIGANCSFKGNSKIGGIAGFARDGGEVKLTNVINRASVTSTGSSDANAAGFIGCATDGTKITALNCANTGTVRGQDGQCAAFAGWTQSGTTFTNCWNIGDINNFESSAQLYRNSGSVTAVNCFDLTNKGNQGTKIDASKLSTGEFCYTLNGDQSSINWYQTIGTDDIPVPFSTGHLQVYANGEMRCDGTAVEGGELTYSNESSSVIPDHQYENGFCKVCDKYQENALTATEGWYEVSEPWQLRWMALSVTNHNDTYGTANIKLTADIDYTAYKHDLFGNAQSTAFRGTFDGQGHTITIDVVNNGTGRTGLFAYINAATIKNLIVEGSATSAGNNCVGGLGGRSDGDGTLIENVVVKTAVSYTGSNGDATCGGLFANMEAQVTLKNCAFLGSINTGTAEGNGGLVGWAGSGSGNKYINCYVAPTEYTQNGNSADFARNNPATTNCIFTSANDARLTSGELCYILNGNVSGGEEWVQTLPTDEHPYPGTFAGHAKVYANGYTHCNGTPKEGTTVTYSNTEGEHRDDHDYQNGFCSYCNDLDVTYLTPVDEYYELGSMNDLHWFSQYVIAGNATANAKLTADVAMESENQYGYTPIGSTAHPYVGHFNGQGHTVSLALNNPGFEYQGLFGVVTDGVFIEKVIVKGYVTGKNYVGGIVGGTNGGSGNAKTTDIWYCGNEATITATGKNGAGIIGVNMDGSASVILTNCYNTGNITSGSDAGALTGWLGGGWSSVTNCYNCGIVKNGENTSKAFCRNNGCYFTNCYYTEGCGTDNSTENMQNGVPSMVADAALASGELCVKLGEAFYQELGTDAYPTTNFYKPSVYEIAVGDAGYATFVPKKNIAALPTDVEAFAAQVEVNKAGYVYLAPVTELPADNAVIVKAAAGSYYCNSTEDERTLGVNNDLTFSNEEVTADGSQYILAKPEGEELGFYKAKSDSKIAARKAYFTNTSGVKAFFFSKDDATGLSDMSDQSDQSEAIFNLAGQRIQKMQKGINIVDGKKMLVK